MDPCEQLGSLVVREERDEADRRDPLDEAVGVEPLLVRELGLLERPERPLREVLGRCERADPRRPGRVRLEERRFPYEEELELEHAVQREGTTSLVASLPEAEREAVLERIREALQGFGEPVRFRCWTEVFVADAR